MHLLHSSIVEAVIVHAQHTPTYWAQQQRMLRTTQTDDEIR